jgi:hypothetical protein
MLAGARRDLDDARAVRQNLRQRLGDDGLVAPGAGRGQARRVARALLQGDLRIGRS